MLGSTSASGVPFRLSTAMLALTLAGGLEVAGHAQQPPVFRSTVDLIAVDVQVMDGDGNPIGQLNPNQFDVSINGKHRRVVSAQFVRHGELVQRKNVASKRPAPEPVEDDAPSSTARTVILAVDSGSFVPGDMPVAMEAARGFLRELDSNDLVGLYVYPTIQWIPPSTQRAPLSVRLSKLVGEKEPIRSYYNLSPHEIVDITAQSTNPNSFLTVARTGTIAERNGARALDPVLKIQSRECPGETDLDCAIKIYSEGMTLATQLEREAQLSLGGLESLLRMLSEIPGRKSVVLVTGGLLVSDRLDGRPDPGDVARVMGQTAARANAIVYTVQIDSMFSGTGQASKHGLGGVDLSRDRRMMGSWLEDFSRFRRRPSHRRAGGRRRLRLRSRPPRDLRLLPARRRAGGRGPRWTAARAAREGRSARCDRPQSPVGRHPAAPAGLALAAWAVSVRTLFFFFFGWPLERPAVSVTPRRALASSRRSEEQYRSRQGVDQLWNR